MRLTASGGHWVHSWCSHCDSLPLHNNTIRILLQMKINSPRFIWCNVAKCVRFTSPCQTPLGLRGHFFVKGLLFHGATFSSNCTLFFIQLFQNQMVFLLLYFASTRTHFCSAIVDEQQKKQKCKRSESNSCKPLFVPLSWPYIIWTSILKYFHCFLDAVIAFNYILLFMNLATARCAWSVRLASIPHDDLRKFNGLIKVMFNAEATDCKCGESTAKFLFVLFEVQRKLMTYHMNIDLCSFKIEMCIILLYYVAENIKEKSASVHFRWAFNKIQSI